MLKTSYVQTAKDHFSQFGRLPADSHFSILRQVIADIEEAGLNNSFEEDPELIASAHLIQTLFNQILEDLTLTTPWDDKGNLKRTRDQALLLAKEALGCLAEYRLQGVQHGDILRTLNKVKSEYAGLLDALNAEDRSIILKN